MAETFLPEPNFDMRADRGMATDWPLSLRPPRTRSKGRPIEDRVRALEVALQVVLDTLDIKDGAITTIKIADLAVSNAKIASLAVDNAKIADLSVSSLKVQDGAITNAKIGLLAVATANIQDAAINNAKIGSLAVATLNVQDGAITNLKIGSLAVATANIQDAAITNLKIASLAVGNAQIQDLAVTNAKINDLNAVKITAGNIVANSIGVVMPSNTLSNANAGFIMYDSGLIARLKINDNAFITSFNRAFAAASNTTGTFGNDWFQMFCEADLGVNAGVLELPNTHRMLIKRSGGGAIIRITADNAAQAERLIDLFAPIGLLLFNGFPTQTGKGKMYFHSGTNEVRVHDGTSWRTLQYVP